MLPNALVTFHLEDIIAAGGLRGRWSFNATAPV